MSLNNSNSKFTVITPLDLTSLTASRKKTPAMKSCENPNLSHFSCSPADCVWKAKLKRMQFRNGKSNSSKTWSNAFVSKCKIHRSPFFSKFHKIFCEKLHFGGEVASFVQKTARAPFFQDPKIFTRNSVLGKILLQMFASECTLTLHFLFSEILEKILFNVALSATFAENYGWNLFKFAVSAQFSFQILAKFMQV